MAAANFCYAAPIEAPMKRLIASLFIVVCCAAFAHAEPITSDRIRVIDGDTIKVDGKQPNIRLVRFNAPETRRAQCDKEEELGARATRRVRDLIRSGKPLSLERVACACRPGTEGTMACNYGRACGTLRVGGRDVGDILISEKLAVPFVCFKTRCPRTPKPWCEGSAGVRE